MLFLDTVLYGVDSHNEEAENVRVATYTGDPFYGYVVQNVVKKTGRTQLRLTGEKAVLDPKDIFRVSMMSLETHIMEKHVFFQFPVFRKVYVLVHQHSFMLRRDTPGRYPFCGLGRREVEGFESIPYPDMQLMRRCLLQGHVRTEYIKIAKSQEWPPLTPVHVNRILAGEVSPLRDARAFMEGVDVDLPPRRKAITYPLLKEKGDKGPLFGLLPPDVIERIEKEGFARIYDKFLRDHGFLTYLSSDTVEEMHKKPRAALVYSVAKKHGQ